MRMRKNVLILVIIAVVGSLFGLFRETLFAAFYGTSRDFEIFLIASSITVLLMPRVGKAVTSTFVPYYYDLKDIDEDIGIKLLLHFKKLSLYLSGSYFLFSVLFYFIDGRDKLYLHMLIMSPTIYFIILSSIITGFYNANNLFVKPAVSNLFINLSLILFLGISILFDNILWLSVGVLMYSIMQYIFLNYYSSFLRDKYANNFKGLKIEKNEKNEFYSLLFPSLLSAIAPVIPLLLIRYLDEYYVDGDIVSFNYANLIVQLIPMLFSVSVLPVITLKMAQLKKSSNNFPKDINTMLILLLIVILPVQLLFFFNDQFLVSILFERGAFTQEATYKTGLIFSVLCLSIAFKILRELLIRYSITEKFTKTAVNNTISYLILSTVSTIVFSYFFGIVGAATSIVIVEFINTLNYLYRKDFSKEFNPTKILVVIIVLIQLTLLLSRYF